MSAPTCEVVIPFIGMNWPCGEPAAGRYRRGCVHEHMRDGWVCAPHAEHAASGLCRDCFDADGHECPITLTQVEVPR